MKGRVPKPAELLQRRNKASTRANLPSEADSKKRRVPTLPKRDSSAEKWHEKVVEWWKTVWTSPMADEFLSADMKGGLYLLAELYQRRWTEHDTKSLVALAKEIRQQETRYGLSPIDRRRLQWIIEKGEVADEKVQSRRRSKKADAARATAKDPRELLTVVDGGQKKAPKKPTRKKKP